MTTTFLRHSIVGAFLFCFVGCASRFKQTEFDGLYLNLGTLPRVSNAKTRSISPENFTGEKGQGGMADPADKDKPNTATAADAARDLGQGWKVNPYIKIESGTRFMLGQIQGPGAIQHIWMTTNGDWRMLVLRIYWDNETDPSVEVPIGDFFGCGWGNFTQIDSLPIAVNSGKGFNSYWLMPFQTHCKIELENLGDKTTTVFYQIDYTRTKVPSDAGYFHAQFRRVNPLAYKDVYTIVDGIQGKGHYVGTTMAWRTNNDGWWGEGEIKFYLDGDQEFPTICGTGTEDYFLGAYCFIPSGANGYREYSTAFSGFSAWSPNGTYSATPRFGLYRWHVMDPIRFETDLKVTIQALGWRSGARYLPLQDDIASVALWYQIEPHAPFPKFPEKDRLEIR